MKDNETYLQYFDWYLPNDGLWWKQCAAKAPVMHRLGISGVWLPPAYKASSQDNVGYAVYDMYDLGEFDQKGTIRTKYGTKDDYLNAVKTLKENHIKVFADIVLNQRMGADETEEVEAVEDAANDRNDDISGEETILAWTKFNFTGRNGKYSDFTWNHTHFTGCDFDERTKRKSVFRFKGKHWSNETDPENGNFDYLMGADVDWNNPEVVDQTERWFKWYIKETHIDGLRLDAVKHIDFDAYKRLLKAVREENDDPLPAVGEYWSGDVTRLTHYLDCTDHEMSLFDVPLHYNFYNASHSNGNYPMKDILSNTLTDKEPDYAVTFVDNHDTEPGQSLESFVDLWFKPLAYAVILLRKYGIPCIFYSDLLGLPPQDIEPVANLNRLIRLRKMFAYGDETDYFDDDNIIGWVRNGDEDHPNSGMAVVMSDNVGGIKRMNIGKKFAGKTFHDCLDKCTDPVTIDDDGWGDFETSGGNVAVWALPEAYEDIVVNS